MQDDPEAAATLDALEIKGGLPVIAKGDEYVNGLELARIDRLFGLTDDESSALLPVDDIVRRARRLLGLVSRYARQLPVDRYDDPIPGMENVRAPVTMPDGTVLVRRDGRHYVPHSTNITLVHHIVGHGYKLQQIAADVDFDVTDVSVYGSLGEPEEDASLDEVCAALESISAGIGEWFARSRVGDSECVVPTFYGDQSVHQLLHSNAYSLTQHTRQLMTVLIQLGIEPAERLTDPDFTGLLLPEGVWA